MKISEIFYSLQGEGARQGEPSVFIRTSGCSAKHACYAAGVRCDTEFESGTDVGMVELEERAAKLNPRRSWIVWTGGEPLDQLTLETIYYFSNKGWEQALETSGARPLSPDMNDALSFVTVSPKVAEHVLVKHFPDPVLIDELRYVRHSGQPIPEPALKAKHYYLSPLFDGSQPNQENIQHCIDLCLQYPQWKLSVQIHKLLSIL